MCFVIFVIIVYELDYVLLLDDFCVWWPSSVRLQYCRVPKNGLPKNGQAGISPKNKNDPGWKNELRTVHHTQRAFAVKTTSSAALLGLRNDSTSTDWNVSAAFPAQHASSHTVCALQVNLRDSKTDCKIRTRLAEVKNKNDPGWDRLPPVLRHPTVLYMSTWASARATLGHAVTGRSLTWEPRRQSTLARTRAKARQQRNHPIVSA